MIKKSICIVLALIFISFVPLGALAAERIPDADIQSDTHFQAYGITLSDTASGNLYISFSVTAKQISAIIGVMNYDIQQKINGEYVTIESALSGHLETDDVSCMFAKYYKSAVPGAIYRVVAHMYCKKYDGTERYLNLTSAGYTMPKK